MIQAKSLTDQQTLRRQALAKVYSLLIRLAEEAEAQSVKAAKEISKDTNFTEPSPENNTQSKSL